MVWRISNNNSSHLTDVLLPSTSYALSLTGGLRTCTVFERSCQGRNPVFHIEGFRVLFTMYFSSFSRFCSASSSVVRLVACFATSEWDTGSSPASIGAVMVVPTSRSRPAVPPTAATYDAATIVAPLLIPHPCCIGQFTADRASNALRSLIPLIPVQPPQNSPEDSGAIRLRSRSSTPFHP